MHTINLAPDVLAADAERKGREIPQVDEPNSWNPEVIADNSGKWCGNSLYFAKKEDAEAWVKDLSYRWMLVRETRVVPSDKAPNR